MLTVGGWGGVGRAGQRRRRNRWATHAIAVGALIGVPMAATAEPTGHGPTFSPLPCTSVFGTFEHAPRSIARCGSVTVPQNRAKPDDPRLVNVVLPVVVFEMPGAKGTPLVFIAGGPGESAIDAVQQVFLETSIGQLLMRERPIVVFDRRGVTTPIGRSSPDLGMFLTGTGPRSRITVQALVDSAKKTALRGREQGVDLKNFGTQEAIEDIRDVALALGYSKLVLFGVSYGTRDALQFIRRYPNMVERAVLDGVAPPQTVTLFDPDSIAAARRAVARQVAAECTADLACNAEYPNLATQLERLGRAGAPPLRITANLPEVGGWRTVDLDPSSLLATIGGAAGIEQVRAIVPQLVEDFTSGDTLRRPLSPEVVLAAAADSLLRLAGPRRMPLIYHVTLCTDTPTGSLAGGGRAVCDALGVPFLGAGHVAPVRSDIPVLLLSSGYDSQTPPALAAEAARTLPRAHHVIFRMVGHLAFRHTTTMACAAVVIESFIVQPDGEPATSCVDTVRPSFLPRRADLPL